MSLTNLSATNSATKNNALHEPSHTKKETSTVNDSAVSSSDAKSVKPVELGDLHKVESFAATDLEQLKRLAQIKEVLAKGDKGADALALDLVANLKANIKPDEKNSEIKSQHLDALKTNIEAKKYKESISGASQMMNLFELESRGASTALPAKNTKGGTVDTIIDTVISFVFGDVIGPGIVSLFKKVGHGPVDRSSLPENGKLAANLAVGSAGFYAAEESIGKFLDPQWKALLPKIRKFMDDKIPDVLININQTGDKLVRQITHGILGVFGKKLEGVDQNNTDFKSEELKDKVVDYIKNRAEYDHKDELHFAKLTKEMLHDNYEKLYGKKMPLPVAKALDVAFACVDEGSPTRMSLLANEAALVAKPLLDKFGPAGAAIYHFFFDVVPNAYIFVTRPIAMFAINHKEKEILEMANNIVKFERNPVEANAQRPELLVSK